MPRAYVRTDGEIGVVRGRIDVVRSVRTQAFERGRVYCLYDAYSVDTTRNRIIKRTVKELVARSEFRNATDDVAEIRSRLLHCLADMRAVGTSPIHREAFRHERVGRNDAEDALVLAICELLFLTNMPTTRSGAHRLTHLEQNQALLRIVFQTFVWRFLERKLARFGWYVEHGKKLKWPVLGESPGLRQYLPGMYYDIRLTSPSGDRVVIIDTKFKNIIMKGRFGEDRFVSADLYQIFTYVHSQAMMSNPPTEAVLLYPAIDRDVSEFMQLPTMKIRFETIDLNLPWSEIEVDLLELFA
jgi:5-methylcytosine-specific restriction enzyme subunit McrC